MKTGLAALIGKWSYMLEDLISTKKLSLMFVALVGVGVFYSQDSQSVNVKKPTVQFEFKKPQQKISREAIAVWIEKEGNTTPLQAVGGYL